MKTLNALGYLSSVLKWGVLLVAFDYQNTELVAACIGVTIFGLMLDKTVRVFNKAKLNELESSKSRERSYLNIIRIKTEKGEHVDSTLLEQAQSATKDTEELYKDMYGFYRPATAIIKPQ